ncbi:hypothetical protein ABE426_04410 [Sphingobacterium faecium]|uniref:hypothetical protein n=1 Tax=Sphingobacterium faecium TaxID=34087 RepID=UPI00320AB943
MEIDILNVLINKFTKAYFDKSDFTHRLIDENLDGKNFYTSKIEEFINSKDRTEGREYCIRKIIEHIQNLEYSNSGSISNLLSGPLSSRINKSDAQSYQNNKKDVYEYKKQLILEYLISKLSEDEPDLHIEMFGEKEYDELLSKIDKIAESLFTFQQKSDIANEIIYDSIDEIKEQLKAQAEKGKIFGKEFVEQQLAGKIMDMAFKGSFFAMLSHAPEQISDIAGQVKGLL